MRSALARLALMGLGLYVGVIGAVIHRHRAELAGIDWPWGLALAIGGAVAIAVAAGHLVRLGETWFALGWTLLLVVQPFAAGGTHLVAGDWLGWAYTLLGAGLLGVVIVRNSRLSR